MTDEIAPAQELEAPPVSTFLEAWTFAPGSIVPHADLARLAAEATLRNYEAGDTLLRDGDEALHVVNIRTGSVKVFKSLPDGRRAVVGFMFRGDFAGLAALEFYSSGVEALEPVSAWRFPRAAFRQLVADRQALEADLLGRVTHDLEVAQEQMLLLSRKTAMERLTSFVLQLARREAEDEDGFIHVRLHMTRSDMADYLGLTTETVSRCFTRLRKKRLVGLENPTGVVLLDRCKLEAIAGATA